MTSQNRQRELPRTENLQEERRGMGGMRCCVDVRMMMGRGATRDGAGGMRVMGGTGEYADQDGKDERERRRSAT